MFKIFIFSLLTIANLAGPVPNLPNLQKETVGNEIKRNPLVGTDPAVKMDVYQLITSQGYPCQQYHVETTDHYILTVQRIPYGKKSPAAPNKKVVFLQHGLLASSADWVINFPTQSLGFILADAGYDVWMGNMRGNTYGLNNTQVPTSSSAFWGFSFDEMAKYDMPAMVEFALATSGQTKLSYVGHSQGTAIGFIQFSQNPTWTQQKIKAFYALAPIAYMAHTTSPIKIIAPYSNWIGFLFNLFGVDEFLPSNEIMKWIGGNLCNGPTAFLCENVLMLIAGYDTKNMNNTRLPVYASHSPAGTSTQDMVHFGQLIATKLFQAFDYGTRDKNFQHYGQATPPQYDPSKMTVPTALFWGDTDIFADPTDVQFLQTKIQHLLGSYRFTDMDHLDFVWGLNAPREVYPQILTLLASGN